MKPALQAALKAVLFLILVFVLPAAATPQVTTYQARIVKPDGLALEANNVMFQFTVLNPDADCILYTETYSSINMSNSGGMVTMPLGSGTKTYPVSATTFAQVFNNASPSLSCAAGGPADYQPASSDVRKIVMQFNDGLGWQTLPAMSINAVPYAIYASDAEKLGGVSATSYVRHSTIPTCTASQALQYSGASFNCVALGGGSGANGTITAGDITTALGYTPQDPAIAQTSFTTVTSSLSTVSATVYSVSSTVNALSNSVTSLSNSIAASFSAVTSSQWSNVASGISYLSGYVGIGTTTPAYKLDVSGVVNATGLKINGIDVGASITSASVISALGYTPQDTSIAQTSFTTVTNSLSSVSSTVNALSNSVTSLSNSFVTSLAAITSSQWATSGSTISYSSGNVGIGTTSPTTNLHVVSENSSAGVIIETASATVARYPSLSIRKYGPSGHPVIYTLSAGGSSSAPTATVLGTLNRLINQGYNGSAYVAGTEIYSYTEANWSPGFTPAGMQFSTNSGAALTTRMTINSSGNVGIGTITPTAKLEIAAGTSATAPLKFSVGTMLTSPQSGAMEYDGSNFYLTDGSNVRRSIATGSSSGTIDNASIINSTSNITMTPLGSVVVSSTTASTNSSTGALVVNGGLGVAGTTNLGGALNVSGSSVIDGSLKLASMTNGSVLFTENGGQISQDNANFYWNNASSRLGIGTNAPTTLLEVRAPAAVSNSTFIPLKLTNLIGGAQDSGGSGVGLSFAADVAKGAIFYERKGSHGRGDFHFLQNTVGDYSEATVSQSVMTIKNNGYVGIGTTTPAFKVELSGTATTAQRKIGINGTQVVYLPDQVNFSGSLFIGNGGGSVSHTSGSEGFNNTGVGIGALYSNTTGNANAANGYQALYTNTTGTNNTANGYQALYANTTGGSNVANGFYSLRSNTTGSNNTAHGLFALYSNTTGGDNVAQGSSALHSNTTGYSNVANGSTSLYANTTGYSNVAAGAKALQYNTIGYNNVANGREALRDNKTKSESTAIGYFSMANADSVSAAPTISYNTAIGAYSLYGSTTAAANTGTANTALGHSSLKNMTSGSNNIGIGYNAGLAITTGSYNIVIGSTSAGAIATSSNNVLIADGQGNERMRIDSTGNVGVGTTSPLKKLHVAGNAQIDSTLALEGINATKTIEMVNGYVSNEGNQLRLTASGISGVRLTDDNGGFINIDGGNVGIGIVAPTAKLDVHDGYARYKIKRLGSTADYQRAVILLHEAYNATLLAANYMSGNIFIYRGGVGSMNRKISLEVSTSSAYNYILGSLKTVAGENTKAKLVTVMYNGVKYLAIDLPQVAQAIENVSFKGFHTSSGPDALTMVSYYDFNTTAVLNAEVNSSIADFLGYGYENIDATYFNISGSVGIGTNNPTAKLDVNGTINIAAGSSLTFGGTGVCTAAGCTASSDERLKENIKPLDFDLNKILSLNAVQYDWKNKSKYGDKHQIGFIAQDLEKVYPEVVYTDKNTGLKSVAYGTLVAPIIEALKSIYQRVLRLEYLVDRQITSVADSKADKTEVEVLREKATQLEADNAIKTKEIDALKSYLCSKDPAAPICK